MRVLCALGGGALAFAAEPADWRNAKGVRFRAEPVAALGPYALFSAEAAANRVVRFGAMSAEDCVRFHRAVAPRPPRAARWADARGALTRELADCLQGVAGADGAPSTVADLPEPELLLIFFHASGATLTDKPDPDILLHSFEPFARRLRRIYPGRVEVVVAVSGRGPAMTPGASPVWMTADPARLAQVEALRGYVGVMDTGLLLMTRDGVPLAGGAVGDLTTLARLLDHASALLWDLEPENRRMWPDRAHYLQAIRRAGHAAGAAPPEMLAPPLDVAWLARLGVSRVEARLALDAEGRVTAATLLPASELPETFVAGVRAALLASEGFLPAVRNGETVPGALDIAVIVPPPPEPRIAAETAWVQGAARVRVPIGSWLVLRPIRADERVLTSVNRVGNDGTVLLHAVTAGTARLDSWRDDWFEHTGGAAQVRPVAGQELEVGGEKLAWQRLLPAHDSVDLARGIGRADFCVGYAWTEVEVRADVEAWLGLGSDDGHKLWVNGQLVSEAWAERPNRLDDAVIPLRLRAGANQILLKVYNETGPWGFIARLRVRDE